MSTFQVDFSKPCNVHFMGIGGISMSGLARILLDKGFTVTGSDSKENELCQELAAKGAKIFYPQAAANVNSNINLVVYTAAIHPDNPEFSACVSLGLPMLTRAQFLGQLMSNYPNSIAVSGTHGKTTTTSMLAHILMAADTDPTISVGGILKAIQGNIKVGSSDIFLTEACEYTNSFLDFYPKYNIILNVEAEHLDFFKDEDDVRASFSKFAENTLENGVIVINHEIKDYQKLVEKAAGRTIISYGLDSDADIYATDISYDEMGRGTYSLVYKNEKQGSISLSVPGKHNVSNSLAAIAVAISMGLSIDQIQKGILSFTGADRRFELKGKLGDITIIDDYAHHPTEVRATMNTALNYPHKRLVVAFQPHTFTRTVAFFDDFIDVLSMADVVVLSDIYAAREKNESGISSGDLVKKLKENGKEAYYIPSFTDSSCFGHNFDALEKFLLKICTDGDLLITMGAGLLNEVSNHLLGK